MNELREKIIHLIKKAEHKREVNQSLKRHALRYRPEESYIYTERSIYLYTVILRLQKSLENYE